MQNTGKYLLSSQRRATIVALLLSIATLFVVPLFVTVCAVIAFITLMRGVKQGVAVLFWALLPLIGFIIMQPVSIPVVMLLFSYLLIAGLSAVLARFNSWTLCLEASVVAGVMFVLVLSFGFPEIQATLAMSAAAIVKMRQAELSTAQVAWLQAALTHLVLGYVVMQMVVINIGTLLVARGTQSRMIRPGMLSKEFRQQRAGKVMSIILLVTILAGILQVEFALQCLPVIVLPYVFATCLLAQNPV